MQAVSDAVPEVVSVDGKTLRRSFDAASKQSPIHMVNAWAGENRLILGQLTVADRSNEIPAVRQLLGTLNLEGATVTADAMHCQRETASQILEQGGDYWLARKSHQELSWDLDLSDNIIGFNNLYKTDKEVP